MRVYSSRRDTPMWQKLKYLRAMRKARRLEITLERLLMERLELATANQHIVNCELEVLRWRLSALEAYHSQSADSESLTTFETPSSKLLN